MSQLELDEYGSGVAERDTRLVICDPMHQYIYIVHDKTTPDSLVDVLSYTPDLYCFLADRSRCYIQLNPDERTQIGLVDFKDMDGRVPYRYLNRFAKLYYDSGQHVNDFVKEFFTQNDILTARGKDVDHVNDDYRNNCCYNLLIMDAKYNRGRKDLIRKIKPPYFCYPVATEDKEILVKFGYYFGDADSINDVDLITASGKAFYIRCEDAAAYKDFAESIHHRFVPVDDLPPILKEARTPAIENSLSDDTKYNVCQNIEIMSEMAEELLSRDKEDFDTWQIGRCWTKADLI